MLDAIELLPMGYSRRSPDDGVGHEVLRLDAYNIICPSAVALGSRVDHLVGDVERSYRAEYGYLLSSGKLYEAIVPSQLLFS
jgi:hypothetical protein